MRRIVAIIVLGSLLSLTACSQMPAGVDGDLTNHWSMLPTASALVPIAGDCYADAAPDMQINPPVPCTEDHEYEVVKVGKYASPAGSAIPFDNSSAVRSAFAGCTTSAKSYLGGDFHGGLLALSVLNPDLHAWQGGARWYACILNKINNVNDLLPDNTTGSARGALAKAGSLKLTCISWKSAGKKDYINTFRPASCAKRHEGEYVGVYHYSTKTYPSSKSLDKVANAACERLVAEFLGLSGGHDYNQTVGWTWSDVDETAWVQGDHGIRCYAASFTHDGELIGSVKGIGLRTAKG